MFSYVDSVVKTCKFDNLAELCSLLNSTFLQTVRWISIECGQGL